MTELSAFLHEIARQPLEWGRCDCCLVVADWIASRVGIDPAADLRDGYADEAGAAAFIAAEGGLVALFERRLTEIAMRRTAAPRPGDVGVVLVQGPDLFGAIATAHGWAVKTTSGLVVSRAFQPTAAWTFADG